jgi:hypothetical protein
MSLANPQYEPIRVQVGQLAATDTLLAQHLARTKGLSAGGRVSPA